MEVQNNGTFFKDCSSRQEHNKENTKNGCTVELKRKSVEDPPDNRPRTRRRNSLDRRKSLESPHNSPPPSQTPSEYGSASERVSAEHIQPCDFSTPQPQSEDPIGWPSWLQLDSPPLLPQPKRHLREKSSTSPSRHSRSPESKDSSSRRRQERERVPQVDRYVPSHRRRSRSKSPRRRRTTSRSHSRGGSEKNSPKKEDKTQSNGVTPNRVTQVEFSSPTKTIQSTTKTSTPQKSPVLLKVGDLYQYIDITDFPLGKGLLVGGGWRRDKKGECIPLKNANPLPQDPRDTSYLTSLETKNLSLQSVTY